MTQSPTDPSGALDAVDTDGDASFTSTYLAVVLVELVVLTALWSFSRYFSL